MSSTKTKITKHAKERMQKYSISEVSVINVLQKPDILIDGYSGRKIAQKRLNDYVLRVIFEERSRGL